CARGGGPYSWTKASDYW
nr:immunoglobulin heavy chain junction region [Macaca mulatta]